jgi:hypothetical protein
LLSSESADPLRRVALGETATHQPPRLPPPQSNDQSLASSRRRGRDRRFGGLPDPHLTLIGRGRSPMESQAPGVRRNRRGAFEAEAPPSPAVEGSRAVGSTERVISAWQLRETRNRVYCAATEYQ